MRRLPRARLGAWGGGGGSLGLPSGQCHNYLDFLYLCGWGAQSQLSLAGQGLTAQGQLQCWWCLAALAAHLADGAQAGLPLGPSLQPLSPSPASLGQRSARAIRQWQALELPRGMT